MLWVTAARVERRLREANRGRWTDERYFVFAVKASWFGYVICGAFLSQEDFDFFYHLLGITSRLVVLTAPIAAGARLATGAATGPAALPARAR